MGKKVSLETIQELLKEVDKANINRARVISDVQNKEARTIIQECSDIVMKTGHAGLAGLGAAYGLGAAGAAIGAAGAGAGIGGAAAGGGIAAGGGAIMGIVGGGAAAAEGGAIGAAAGAPIPIIGPLIGAGVGIVIGGIVGGVIVAKQKNKRERLYQEGMSKQNGAIKALTNEVQELQQKVSKKDEEIARLKYLVGLLSAYIDSMGALSTATA